MLSKGTKTRALWDMNFTAIWGKGSHQWGGGVAGSGSASGTWGNGLGRGDWDSSSSLWDGFKGLFK